MAGCSTAQRWRRRQRQRATQTAPRRRTAAAAASSSAGNGQPGRGPRLPTRVWVRQQRRGDRDRDGRHIFHEAEQEEAKVRARACASRFGLVKRASKIRKTRFIIMLSLSGL